MPRKPIASAASKASVRCPAPHLRRHPAPPLLGPVVVVAVVAVVAMPVNIEPWYQMISNPTFPSINPGRLAWLRRICFHPSALGLALAIALPTPALAGEAETFASPQAAVNALVLAAQNNDTNAIHAIFGPEGHQLISPDLVQATEEYHIFVQRLTEKVQISNQSPSNAVLEIGADGWPFPIPLVQQDGQWSFDPAAGQDEIFARRIGMNELGALSVCTAYVEAQHEYASQDRLNDGVFAYAQFLRSTPGTHDGLFWPADPDGEMSPLGPLIAQARVEGYHRTAKMLNDEQAPYHGYYFKILTRQGKLAPGGKYDYVITGRMIAGFALVAWPAEWGNSGVMTFIVNQQGRVFQKNLGPRTAKIARAIKVYAPDETWTPAAPDFELAGVLAP